MNSEELANIVTNCQIKYQNKMNFQNELKNNVKEIRKENDQVIQANQQLSYDID